MNDKAKRTAVIKRWLPLLILAALMAATFGTGLHEKLSLEALQARKEDFATAAASHPLISALTFLGVYGLSVALSLPIATLLTLLGGFLFGKWLGTLYVVTAATLGASIVFLIARSALGQTLREKAGGLYARIEGNMKENAAGYMLFMRLVPLFPFFLINIVPALFNVPLRTFVLTTFFGIIPGSFVYVNAGETLGEITSLKDLVSGQTLVAFALLGLFALLPTLYKQFKTRKVNGTLAVLLLTGVLASPSGTVKAAASYEQFLGLYGSLVDTYVHAAKRNGIAYNGVDYDSWSADLRHKKARAALQESEPAQFGSWAEKMAFWSNAYNFLTIDLIVREDERDSIKNLGSLFTSPWQKFEWRIAGEFYTLDQIEHEILRPMGDARIHFAINCAALSCPDLRDEPYKASILDAQLDE